MNSPRNVICFSSIDWDFIWQGHQEIMSTLASQGTQVLFVENTGVRNPQLRDLPRIRRRLANWWRSLQGFRKERENLYVFSPLVLPFPYSRLARWINRWLIVSAMQRWMRATEFSHPVIWTFLPSPLTLDVIQRVPHAALIYYCIDSFADSTPAAQRIVASEDTLLRRADLVFVTSQQLYDRAIQRNRSVHLFPFGVSQQAFEQVQRGISGPPAELQQLSRPIVGYVGGIHQWVDQELLCYAARALPGYSFALVGPIQTDIKRVLREPNIVLLGQKPHEMVLEYVRHFDVGIIPYRLTDYTKNVYPTKLNEYHVMGKPVVSTPLPEVLAFNRRYNGLIKIGASEEDFPAAIKRALQEDAPRLRERRAAAAHDNAWNRRIAQMQGLIDDVIVRKTAHPPENWAGRFLASLRASQAIWRAVVGMALALAMVFYTPVVWYMAEPLRRVDVARPTDAIVVFAGGVGDSGQAGEGYRERVQQAVELFRQGYAPRILFISGYTSTFQEAQIMRVLTESLGVPAGAILMETQVRNTHDYVRQVGVYAQHDHWKSVLLVTSPYHARRAALTFARAVPALQVLLIPAPSSYYAHSWRIAPHQIHGILHEYAGILYYRWKGWL